MKNVTGVACFLLCLCLVAASGQSQSQAQSQAQGQAPTHHAPAKSHKSEKFSALAYLPAGAGRAMVGSGATASVDIYVRNYTSDHEARVMAGALRESPDTLLKMLQKAKSIGKITLTGRVGFYDLKLIRSHPTKEGRRIYAVGDRPMGFLELYHSGQSRDYEFGILMLDLKKNKKGREEGQGTLIYAAKIKLLNGNNLDVENYGVDPVRLMGVRLL